MKERDGAPTAGAAFPAQAGRGCRGHWCALGVPSAPGAPAGAPPTAPGAEIAAEAEGERLELRWEHRAGGNACWGLSCSSSSLNWAGSRPKVGVNSPMVPHGGNQFFPLQNETWIRWCQRGITRMSTLRSQQRLRLVELLSQI